MKFEELMQTSPIRKHSKSNKINHLAPINTQEKVSFVIIRSGSMQMMLLQFYLGSRLELCVLCDEDGLRQGAESDVVLSKLHTEYRLL